jgi:hypothetical protein
MESNGTHVSVVSVARRRSVLRHVVDARRMVLAVRVAAAEQRGGDGEEDDQGLVDAGHGVGTEIDETREG